MMEYVCVYMYVYMGEREIRYYDNFLYLFLFV